MRFKVKPWDQWSKVDKFLLWVTCAVIGVVALTVGS